MLVADQKDGEPDFSSSDEDYLFAAYRVALGREPGTSSIGWAVPVVFARDPREPLR